MNLLVKVFAFAATVFLVSQAQAQSIAWVEKDIHVSYSSFHSYYSCDYAEQQTEKILNVMGAQGMKVTCSGGLPYNEFVSVRARFQSAIATIGTTEDNWSGVKFKVNEACDFNESIARQLAKHFTTRNVKVSSSCWDSQGSFKLTAEVLK
ncbi:MAG: hypothetical protein V4736_05375 [Bdellovibrionota bacterium]